MSFPKIYLFGDSLIEQSFALARHGFGAALANAYARRADVLNRGLSGYNTSWLLPFLHALLAAPDAAPALLWVIWAGANDAVLPPLPHHVPVATYAANLRAMVVAVRAEAPAAKVLVITPPPINHAMLVRSHRRHGADRDPAVVREYATEALAMMCSRAAAARPCDR